jgi:hypothetical protein
MIYKFVVGSVVLAFSAAVAVANQPSNLLPAPADGAADAVPKADAEFVPGSSPCCNYRTVEQTVMQPVFVRTKRKVQTVDYREEPRRRIVRVMKPVYETKNVDREITVMVPEKRTRTETYTVCKPVTTKNDCGCCVTEYVHEKQTREVSYTVCVPTKQTISVPVTTCRHVPEERTTDYVACVPVNVEKEVDVVVCRMVPKKVVLQVPVCPPVCGGCCN